MSVLERAMERNRGLVLGLTAVLLFSWSFIRAPILRMVGSWIVLFDIFIVVTVLSVGQKMMAQWKSPVAKIAASTAMVFWAFIFVREAIHILLFLLLSGTQPQAPV